MEVHFWGDAWKKAQMLAIDKLLIRKINFINLDVKKKKNWPENVSVTKADQKWNEWKTQTVQMGKITTSLRRMVKT